jgi:phosphoribosyl-AMP cyclohydrolase
MNWINEIKWDDKGLVPVIAQEQSTGDVLMFAWMNREAVQKTAELGRAVYFSRSRNKLWFKGEESGHVQTVHSLRMDCDGDVLLLTVTQLGHEPEDGKFPSQSDGKSPLQSIACHTGRHSCFFNLLEAPQSAKPEWKITEPVLKNPDSIYK